MPDVLKSILGRKFGIDTSGNAVLGEGNSIFGNSNATTRPPRIAFGDVATAPTTVAGLAAYGTHFLTSLPGRYMLEDPVPGQRVTIITETQTTGASRYVQVSTANGVTFGTSGAFNVWNSSAAQSLQLVGKTTLVYGVISNDIASTLSTSVGAFTTV